MQTHTREAKGNGHNEPTLAATVRAELEKLRKPGRPSKEVKELRAQLEKLEKGVAKKTKPLELVFDAEAEDKAKAKAKPGRKAKVKDENQFEIPLVDTPVSTNDKHEQLSKRGIVIPPIEMMAIEVDVVCLGGSTLIQHAWDPKTVRQMEEDQTKESSEKETRVKRPPRVPQAEWDAARYRDVDGNDCAPAVQFKKCMVAAASMLKGATIGNINSAVFVKGTGKNFNLVPIKYDGKKPVFRTDMVKVGKFPNKQPTPRYRPEYPNWRCTLRIEFLPAIISAKQVVNLLNWGGFCKGVAEWRPERGGEFGRFRVAGVRGLRS